MNKFQLNGQHFSFVKELGQGAYATVYLYISNGRKYAVKVLEKDNFASLDTYQKEITNEANILSLIGCTRDDLVCLRGVTVLNNKYAFITDYIEGDPISKYVKESIEDVTKIVMSLLSTIEYLRSIGISHNDISMNNVILTNQHKPVLIDFGRANNILSTIDIHKLFVLVKDMLNNYQESKLLNLPKYPNISNLVNHIIYRTSKYTISQIRELWNSAYQRDQKTHLYLLDQDYEYLDRCNCLSRIYEGKVNSVEEIRIYLTILGYDLYPFKDYNMTEMAQLVNTAISVKSCLLKDCPTNLSSIGITRAPGDSTILVFYNDQLAGVVSLFRGTSQSTDAEIKYFIPILTNIDSYLFLAAYKLAKELGLFLLITYDHLDFFYKHGFQKADPLNHALLEL